MKVSLLENRLNQAANLTKVTQWWGEHWGLRNWFCVVFDFLFLGGGMNKFAKKVWKMKIIHTKKRKLLLVIWVRGVFFGGKQMISIWVYRYILDWTCFNQRIDDVKSFLLLFSNMFILFTGPGISFSGREKSVREISEWGVYPAIFPRKK